MTDWKIYALSFALLIIVLFKFKNPLQFYVKFAVYFWMTIFYSLSIIPFVLLRPGNPKNVEWVSMTLGNLQSIFGMTYELENEKYLQINQPYILLVNHQSSVDFITMCNPVIWPGGNCTPLAKKELLYTGPFGPCIWLCGITFIDRLHRDKSRSTMDKLAKKVNDENLRIWIYPEGTRNASTELLPFKKGAFHLAVEAQVPIVCMVTSSYLNFYSKAERKWNFGGKVKCRVLPPFQTKGMTSDSVDQLSKHIRNKMQKEFDDLNIEMGLDEKYRRKESTVSEEVEEDENKFTEEFLNLNENDFENLEASVLGDESINKDCLNDDNNNSINDDNSKKMN